MSTFQSRERRRDLWFRAWRYFHLLRGRRTVAAVIIIAIMTDIAVRMIEKYVFSQKTDGRTLYAFSCLTGSFVNRLLRSLSVYCEYVYCEYGSAYTFVQHSCWVRIFYTRVQRLVFWFPDVCTTFRKLLLFMSQVICGMTRTAQKKYRHISSLFSLYRW